MKELNPAKIASICFLFLLVLYLTSGIDLAIAAAFISIAFLNRLKAAWLFISSFIFFSIYLSLGFLNIKPDYISDLSISSYALFVAGSILYFRQEKLKNWELKIPMGQRFNLSQTSLYKIGGILIFIFLIYPVTGLQLAAISGYLVFLVLFQKPFEGRFAFSIAIFFLILCPFLLFARKDKLAESSAIITFYFLVIGVIQEIVSMVKNPPIENDADNIQIKGIGIISGDSREIKIDFRRWIRFIAFGSLSFIIGFLAVNFIQNLSVRQISKKPKENYRKIEPTNKPIVINPTSKKEEPKIKLSSESGKLQVLVENGSETTGAAATAAAILKNAGFKNVIIGNAFRQDYKSWEMILKKSDETLVKFIKQTLVLSTLTLSEATAGAKYDIQLIIGENK